MVRRAAVLVGVLLATVSPVRADSPALTQAREAIDAVRYDDARTLLEAALAEGGNSPAATAEIYRLLANTLVVLGQPALAEQQYRRWLELDPQASLPTTAAAKLRQRFLAAQAYVQQHGALSISVATRTERSIELAITSNPSNLAAFATVDASTAGARVPIGDAPRLVIPLPPGARLVRVVILDAHGNQLLELPVGSPGDAPAAVTPTVTRTAEPTTPLVRRWQVWAVSTVALAATGAYFGYQARGDQDTLDEIAGTRGEFFFSDYETALDRRDRNNVVTGALLITGGLCAITSIVMFATRPSTATTVVPAIVPSGAVVTVGGVF